MKGVIKIKEDKSWVVEYQVWDDDKTYELPLLPESGLTIRVMPDLEVEFKEQLKDDKVYAKILPEKTNRRKLMKGELNYPLQYNFSKPCQICDESIEDAFSQPLCDGCLEALKQVILEKKELLKNNK